MTRKHRLTVTCPCCRHESAAVEVTSYTTVGASTEFRQVMAGDEPLADFIHTCPACGYTAAPGEFAAATVEPAVELFVRERLTPLVEGGPPPPWRRYEFAARLAELRGVPAGELGALYLGAAWCCDDAGRADEALAYRRRALGHFERALEAGEVPAAELPAFTFRLGELCRRVGDAEGAQMWFERVAAAARAHPESHWLIDLAVRQQVDPQLRLPSRPATGPSRA